MDETKKIFQRTRNHSSVIFCVNFDSLSSFEITPLNPVLHGKHRMKTGRRPAPIENDNTLLQKLVPVLFIQQLYYLPYRFLLMLICHQRGIRRVDDDAVLQPQCHD